MKISKCILILLILLPAIALTACGNIKGEYVQLSSPFGSDVSTPDASLDASSEQTSSDTAPVTGAVVNCKDEELVRVTDYIPDAKVDIKYATSDNFTGGKVYDFDDAYLRYGTVMKLKKAADALRQQGYLILIWDGYRPQESQFTLFENAPDRAFVSDPNKGFSSHSSGGTVDITLVKSDGSPVEMPTGFDEFSAKADRDYSDVSEEAGNNSKILEKAMTDAGFSGYSKEWWHYTDTQSYGYDDIKGTKPAAKSKQKYYADCEEYINLRKTPETDSEVIAKIPADAELTPYCWYGGYVGVKYEDKTGYVSIGYIK